MWQTQNAGWNSFSLQKVLSVLGIILQNILKVWENEVNDAFAFDLKESELSFQ